MSLVERVLQRDPAGVLRAHGLPEPRPLPAGGRGARRADRGSPGAGGPARGGERPPGRRDRGAGRARRARRLPPDREGPPRAGDRRGLASRPGQGACAGSLSRTRPSAYLGAIGLATAAARRRGRARTPGAKARLDVGRWSGVGAAPPASRRARWPSRSSSAWRRASRRRDGCRASTSRRAIPEDARTLVVVPTLLTSVEVVERQLEHLEVLALGNLDPADPLRHPRRLRGRRGARHARRRRHPRRGPRRASRR